MNGHITDTQARDLNIERYLSDRKQTVDEYLDRLLPASDAAPTVVHQAMRYSVFAGGKRIRPTLALATAEALGGSFQVVIPLACALEMIHTYSLMHDDLPAMDDDDYRRGRLTAHRKFGEGIAILAGNGLLTLAFHCLARTPIEDQKVTTKVAVIQYIAEAIGTVRGLLGGQAMDLAAEGQTYSEAELENIHASKTGALIRASIYCAALLSDASETTRQHLESFGSKVGLAFQIVDDILDVEGSSRELGKTSGKDGLSDKATYPALYGLERSREIAGSLVDEAIEETEFLGSEGNVLKELARFISVRRF